RSAINAGCPILREAKGGKEFTSQPNAPAILKLNVREAHHLHRFLHHRGHLRRRLRRNRPPHGDRIRLHPATLRDHHAVRRIPRAHRPAQSILGRHRRSHRLQSRLHPPLLARPLGRPPSRRALRPLHPPQPSRPRPHRTLLPPLRRNHRSNRPSAA